MTPKLLGSLSILLASAGMVWPRCAAAEVEFSGGITAVYQVPEIDDVDPELSASLDLEWIWPRQSGGWYLYVEGSTAPDSRGVSSLFPTANGDAGSVLNKDGDGGLQVSELHYTFQLAGSRRLTIGLIDTSALMDLSRITSDENDHFLNGSFVNNATIEFPDYTLGAVLRLAQTTARPEISLVLSSSDGIADLPDRSYQDLLKLTSDERGVFLGVGSKWTANQWITRIGGWVRTDHHEILGDPGNSEFNFGGYAGVGWKRANHSINFRLGLANEDVSVASRFIAMAYEFDTTHGLFGAAVARTAIADSFRMETLENITTSEIFYRIPLGKIGGHLTPSLQYVENPGFDGSGSALPLSSLVWSLRFRLAW